MLIDQVPQLGWQTEKVAGAISTSHAWIFHDFGGADGCCADNRAHENLRLFELCGIKSNLMQNETM